MNALANAPRLAELLGFDADARIAIVHADDIGMCHAANQGAFETLQNGPVTCGSLMVPCPWFTDAANRARELPDVDLGVHLTLNCEYRHYRWGPVVGRSEAPSLCAPDGGLWPTVLETAKHARPEHVELELRAQIQRALDAGVDVTHVDTHMGTAFRPVFVEIYARLALEFGLPAFAVRPGNAEVGDRPLQLGPIIEAMEVLAGEGWPLMDAYCADSLSFARDKGLEHNLERLKNLKPGVTYFICHPAQGGVELDAITEDAHCREFERSFYGSASGREALEAAGIHTVGMRRLRDLLRDAA